MSEDKTITTIRIDNDLLSRLRDIANKEKRSLNQQVEYAIEYFVKDYEKIQGIKSHTK